MAGGTATVCSHTNSVFGSATRHINAAAALTVTGFKEEIHILFGSVYNGSRILVLKVATYSTTLVLCYSTVQCT